MRRVVQPIRRLMPMRVRREETISLMREFEEVKDKKDD